MPSQFSGVCVYVSYSTLQRRLDKLHGVHHRIGRVLRDVAIRCWKGSYLQTYIQYSTAIKYLHSSSVSARGG